MSEKERKQPLIVPVRAPKVDEIITLGDRVCQVVQCTPRELSLAFTAAVDPGSLDRFQGAELVGWALVEFDHGETLPALLVRRARPFVPFGADPLALNRECARTFAIVMVPGKEPFTVFEVKS
jgi:hypothetical protein